MWITDEINHITAIGPANIQVKAYSKVIDSAVDFAEISGEFEYKGNNIHELECSFPKGKYMIRVDDVTNGYVDYVKLIVEDKEKHSRNTNNKVSQILNKLIRRGF